MSYMLFIDESGHDGRNSPYSVLSGIAIHSSELWNIIQKIHELELKHFGLKISGLIEVKGKKFLKNKVFKFIRDAEIIPVSERSELSPEFILKSKRGDEVRKKELIAFHQSKYYFVKDVINLCISHSLRSFASIVDSCTSRPKIDDKLQKDYVYLFERYFYFLEDLSSDTMGIIVFDELEKSKCQILLDQMENYFIKTEKGRSRASQIVPEPFFVYSELTTAIQIADLIAYITSWGVRLPYMFRESREDLSELARLVCKLRYKTTREIDGHGIQDIWSFNYISDLG